jgi:hypothetical protein
MKRVGDFMAWLGGGEKEGLGQLPQDRAHFIQMAGVLVTTAGIAVLSMTFALHNGVKFPLASAIIFALLWGFVILNLDRFLVLSMSATGSLWRQVGIALPRLALAAVLALVVSTPLVLRIFATDINEQLFKNQLETSQANAALEAKSGDQQEANRLLTKINTDKAILNGHLPSMTSPQLQNAQMRVAQLQPQVTADFNAEVAAREAWQCELYGSDCAGGSGVPGNGPQATAKQMQYEQAVQTYDSAANQLQAAKNAEALAQQQFNQQENKQVAATKAQAGQDLPGLQSQYNKLEAKIQSTLATSDNVDQANTGILAQLQALSQASAKSPSLEAARLTLLALFFLIEILPVTVKFLLNLNPESTYHKASRLREEEFIDGVRRQYVESRRIEQRRSEMRINVEDDMRQREEGLGKQANEHVAEEMTKILDVALLEWSKQVQARLSGAVNEAAHNGAHPPPHTEFNQGYDLPDGVEL